MNVSSQHTNDLRTAECDAASCAGYDVVLVPSFADVDRYRKAHSPEIGIMATLVTTFNGWVAQLWELLGDGRTIIGPIERRVALQRCFDDEEDAREQPHAAIAPGFVLLADECVRLASGLEEFEAAIEGGFDGAGLSGNEQGFLSVVGRYKRMIARKGLIELGDVLAALAQRDDVLARPTSVLVVNASPLSWQQRRFLSAFDNLSVTIEFAPGSAEVASAPQGVALLRAQASGPYAQPGLIADLVRERCGAGPMVVTCVDPLSLYDELAQPLARMGISCGVQARGRFVDTAFGRTFMAMLHCLTDEPWNPKRLADVLFSPFSGLTLAQARSIDAQLRADRLIDRDSAVSQLRAFSDVFSQLEEVVSDCEADVLLGVFENIAMTHSGWSDAYRREQLGAIGALGETMRAARSFHLDITRCAHALAQTVYDFSRTNGEGDTSSPLVLITTQRVAASLSPQSCATLIMADMNSDSYPVADKDDAKSTLFRKLGLEPVDSALARARRDFHALLQLPTEQVVFERALHDANADETYPCATLEEFLDADHRRRCAAAASSDGQNAANGGEVQRPDAKTLEASFGAAVPERGEEALFENATASSVGSLQPTCAIVDRPQLVDLDANDGARIMLASSLRGPSPSQVELYLECPFKWFAQRRLNLDALDEQFGALERGNYAHAAFERFYREFQARGQQKVSAANLEQAQQVMRDVLGVLRVEQELADPKSGRLVAATSIEAHDLDSFENQLVTFLGNEARLLPSYRPAYLEFAITPEMGVRYAGRSLVGKVDRIDVDDEGHAVIFDYKGSVGSQHEIAGKTYRVAGKVQTRMYAQAVKRALGLQVVGAFYVSYGKRFALAGAYDPTALDAAHLPRINARNCSCAAADAERPDDRETLELASLTFASMLDATEEAIGEAVDRMEQGVIDQDPATPDACTWCDVAFCPKRGD